MKTVNMHEAKTHLSRLVDQAAHGDPFIIAKAGRPLVKVIALDESVGPPPRVGMLSEVIIYPEDPVAFAEFGEREIERLFRTDE